LNVDGVQLRPDYLNELDGFSTTAALLAWFEDVSLEGVVGHEALGGYEKESVKTLIVHAETGERVPHFVELDATAEEDGERLLSLQPMAPLEHGARYVVGIRGLVSNDGSEITSSPVFKALRDDTRRDDFNMDNRREHFSSDVFPVLETQGFSRSELQLAWDFVTVSKEHSLGRLEWIRDDALERTADGFDYSIDTVVDGDCDAGDKIARTLEGTFSAPLYTEVDDEGTFLTRDADGMPFYNGETQVDFLVRVPCTLAQNPHPARLLQYGHGLLGDRYEANTGHLQDVLQQAQWPMIAVDWTGMASKDRGQITMMLVMDTSDFPLLPERSMQGMVQAALAVEFALKSLSQDAQLTFNGTNVIDPERTAYYGISQGGILGGGYVAMSRRIERAVLGVPGSPYDLILQRSVDFDPFFDIFRVKFDDHREIRLLLAVMQTLWDPAEAAGWLGSMNRSLRPDTTAKSVLIQSAIGDAQVATIGGQMMARAYGASTVFPQARAVFGVEELTAPFEGSALVEWEYADGSVEPVENLPPSHEGDTHECPRREPAAQAQLIDFLETGVIHQYCLDTAGNPEICRGDRAGLCD